MNKLYNISEILFDNDYMIIKLDSSVLKVKVKDASGKLDKATDTEKSDFKISPSGYGIHWNRLDEDLSVNGLIKLAKSVNGYFGEIDLTKING